MVSNPTLLEPGTWKWIVHYTTNPFASYFPFAWNEAPGNDASGTHPLATVRSAIARSFWFRVIATSQYYLSIERTNRDEWPEISRLWAGKTGVDGL